ncbi:MAG: YifB family Mg chelatase-like AAA ATPase [Kineosporiaceae bacterium]
MSLGRCLAVSLIGVEGHLVQVEADIAPGLPSFTLVGLPDTAVVESRDRVRAASANSGCPVPPRRITVNLSPAALPKAGTAFDLAVAAALLAAAGAVPADAVEGCLHLGELGLDGSLRPVTGVLPAVLAAARAGVRRAVVAPANLAEATLVPEVAVVAVSSLEELVRLHRGLTPGTATAPQAPARVPAPADPDLRDVIGQADGRRALEIAAAGGHHLFLLGPPGAGKTMLAARLPGLLPDLVPSESLEVTAVHSVSGTLGEATSLITRPPFEDPHHTSSMTALVGGGTGIARPGAASRAHRGVLFLDEAPEFGARALDALRQPLEQGRLSIHRAKGVAHYPARFQLVLAANPCPCGRYSGGRKDCECSPLIRRRYLARLSGPLLDRVDLRVELLPVGTVTAATGEPPEASAVVRARVAQARERQRRRWRRQGWGTNGEAPGAVIRALDLPRGATRDLDTALQSTLISLRGYDRVLRVAWTIADLAGLEAPGRKQVGEALTLRGREVAS